MKTVSVIIPCFLDSATLARAIDSVLAQDYPAIEIIVVNDSSPETEAIESVMRQYPKVIYLRNVENLGLASSRNRGIKVASGEYIALLDADDEYLPEKISTQLLALEPGVALTCGLIQVRPDGRWRSKSPKKRPERLIHNSDKLIYRNTINGAGLLIERTLLLMHGGFDETLRSCEDFDLWLRLLKAGIKIKEIGQPLYLYYENPLGLSRNLANISKWEAEVIRRYIGNSDERWARSSKCASIVMVWLCRQIMRYEVERNVSLSREIRKNFDLLSNFPILSFATNLIFKLRLLYFPAIVLHFFGMLRSG